MSKTGEQHVAQLRDGREIYLDGARVEDHVDHPAFRNAVRSAAALYDFQSDPAHLEAMTFASPTSGARVHRSWQLPTSYDELVRRRAAMEQWAALSCGMLGRSPDHVASCLTGMVGGVEAFAAHSPARARALVDYHAYARDRDLFLSYVLVNPQADRSKATAEQPSADLVAHVVDEDHDGITISGAKMLGTSTVLANELLVGSIQPLKPGEERYAFTAVLPLATPGLKLLSRRSYEQAATSEFDYPLASRFDENDAVVVFDEAKVPWERVLAYGDVAMQRAQFHATPAQVLMGYQGQVRLMVKLRFLVGLARRIAETNGTLGFPQVQERLGHLAAQAGLVEGLVAGMEAQGTRTPGGAYVPSRRLLHSAHAITQELYPQVVHAIRELAGGGVIMVPSSERDLVAPDVAALVERTQQSPVASAGERVKLFKLAWDALGSEFGSRHVQYEMFYSGATFVTRGNAFRSYDWERATGLVDALLDSYPTPAPAAQEATP
jgi:4-hydroxyphenylacetate 3-monooxygenase